jgi:anti-anti-sigma factor
MASSFRATLRSIEGLSIIDLSGDLESAALEPALTAAYTEAAANGSRGVVLNFREVGYINSTGIALIVGLLARARRDHRAVTAFGLGEHYREIFQITRLADFMTIQPDEQSALNGARRGS